MDLSQVCSIFSIIYTDNGRVVFIIIVLNCMYSQQVGKTALKRRPYIKVLNVTSKEEKTLYDDCEGNFTTAPSALQLFLPEILENLGDCLPLQVRQGIS